MPASISRPKSDRYTTLASSGFLAVQDSASTVSSSVPLPNDTASRGPRPMSSTIKSAPPMTYNYFHGSKNDEDARSQVFNFKDDDASTINPGDSVSQLGVDRGERKKLVGARALVPSTLGGVNRIEEEEEAQEGYGWVNPDAVLFDSDDHAGHDKSAFHPIEEQYEREEEDDDGRSYRSNRESASAPLVAGAEGISGHELESAFAPKTVRWAWVTSRLGVERATTREESLESTTASRRPGAAASSLDPSPTFHLEAPTSPPPSPRPSRTSNRSDRVEDEDLQRTPTPPTSTPTLLRPPTPSTLAPMTTKSKNRTSLPPPATQVPNPIRPNSPPHPSGSGSSGTRHRARGEYGSTRGASGSRRVRGRAGS